jgi:hypothetical protein
VQRVKGSSPGIPVYRHDPLDNPAVAASSAIRAGDGA